jgi:catechol-2,3-dioxygenase
MSDEGSGRVHGVFETALFVRDLFSASDFYQQVLGLDKFRESDDACVFTVAKGQLLLLISKKKARMSSKTRGVTCHLVWSAAATS